MAYLDLTLPAAAASDPLPLDLACRAADSDLSALEWSVVALARRDSIASLREAGRVSRAMSTLFGGSTGRRLADERLEALRRIAVHAWHAGWRLPVSEIETFVAAGFSLAQFERVMASIGIARAHRGRSTRAVARPSLTTA